MKREITIRELQHYVYCPHRWGLIHIGCDWDENLFVNRAQIMHKNADDGKSKFFRGKNIVHSVCVYNDDYGLYGILDCLELIPSNDGCYVEKYGERFAISVVEYKPHFTEREAADTSDKIQLIAQKVCVDKMFETDASAYIYYADTKKRRPVEFSAHDYKLLENTLEEIRRFYTAAEIPPIKKKQYCGGCSIRDICMPNVNIEYA